MKIVRRKSKVIKIGNLFIGGNHPIAIQSMAKTKTADLARTIKQIKELEAVGCEIVRLAIKDSLDAKAIERIKQKVNIPIVADIHYDWRFALEAIDRGADKIRLNPGNIYRKDHVIEIAKAAKKRHIPIRVGMNSGSLPETRPTFGGYPEKPETRSVSDRMVRSALGYVKILEDAGFYDIVISLKASSILDTIEAYQKMSKYCDYPMHLGVTAAGPSFSGVIKSSVAVGSLLLQGIGDTIRISLTDQAQEEVRVAKQILEAVRIRRFGPEIISCPTCGRCEVDLVKIVRGLESKLSTMNYQLLPHPIKLAVMGCVVNGPGEAREADIGVAFGKKEGLLFKNGKPLRKVSLSNCIPVLLKELKEA